MTGLGAAGILLSFLPLMFVGLQKHRRDYAIFSILALMHIGATFYYHDWAKTNLTDSTLYYFDDVGLFDLGFGLNTQFVVYLVQTMRNFLGGTYLDYFLLFQASGVWAIAFMLRTIEEIHLELNCEPSPLLYAVLFLPSLHFFTASIGKDGPLVLAVAMAVWSVMAFRRRMLVFAAALLLMVLFRPHIALIVLASFAAASFLDPRASAGTRLVLAAAGLVAGGVVAATIQSTFAVDVSNSDSVSDFFTRQSELAQSFDDGAEMLTAPFAMRLLSLLFRPLFLDAEDMLGYVASLENSVGLLMFTIMVFSWREVARLARRIVFFQFSLAFSIAVILLLAYVYYNVGLGMRQRTMLAPALIAMFAAVLALRQRRSPVQPAIVHVPA